MSSKHRRLRPRSGYQRPYGTPAPGPDSPSSGGHSRRGTLLLVLALLVIVGVVYAVTRPKAPPTKQAATPPTQTPPAKAPPPRPAPIPGPIATFASTTYDFGRAPGDIPVDCLFTVTNTGIAMLEIPIVTPGCSCMKTNGWTRQIPPGQTGTIAIRLDTHHLTGRFAKSVFVTCNDSNQPNINLEITGHIWRPLEITPPTAVISLSSEAPSNNTAVRIISHLDEPLTLSDLQSTLPNLALELQTNHPGKEYQINVRTLPPLPTSSLQGQISFKTSATNVPTTNLATYINYQPVLQAVPYQLRLPAPPVTNTFSAMAWVRNNGTNPLVISETTVNVPGVEVKVQDDPVNQGQSLTLNFPAGFQIPAGTNAELTIKTTHPLHPVLRVPIFQAAPAAAPPQSNP